MSSSEERELFLEYLKKIYIQNPNFEITMDTIYNELRAFSVQDGVQTRIDRDNLIGIQARLSNNFAKKIKCFSNGYFFAIENRGQYVDDKTFYDKMNNSIKLYVSCDIKNLYNVSKSLFDYIIKENIITQSKVAKEMRNDVLVVRVSSKEEAIKVKNYVNSLKYKSTVKANPFILNTGNVSMTLDCGTISYNWILCKLLKNYFDSKRSKRELDNVSIKDFSKFVKREIFICSQNSFYLLNEYQNGGDLTNFVKTANVLVDNLDGVLTEDKLFEYQNINNDILTNDGILVDDRKEMRNDVLVVRVSSKEEAIKVKNYVNSLKYKSTVKANPFILNTGNVSMTLDCGTISYNWILCKLLKNYFDSKRSKRELDNVSIKDFSKFVKREIFICSQNSFYLLNEYQNGGDLTNFVKTANVLVDNLDGVLTEDKLFEYQNINNDSLTNDGILVDDRKDKLLYVIYKLSNYYDINYVHKILVHYVNTGEVKVFTRKDSIRNIIMVNFPPDVLKKEIVDMGRQTFYECIQLTLEKYNKDQCIYAIARFIINGELDGFTRNHEVRNKLGFLVPKEWFSLIIKNELGSENDKIIDKINMLSKEEKDIIIKKIGNVVMNGLASSDSTFNDLTDDIILLSVYMYNASIKEMEELQSKKIGRK